MAKTVVGFFDAHDQARSASDELVRQGIDPGQISLIGAVAGATIGALVDIGVPQEDAHLYSEGVQRGGTLLVLRAADTQSARRAADSMNQFGAQDIKRRSIQWNLAGQTAYAAPPSSPGAAAGGISPPHPGEEQREDRQRTDEKRIPVGGPTPGDRERPEVTVVEEFISITKDPANREDLSPQSEHGGKSPSPQNEDGREM